MMKQVQTRLAKAFGRHGKRAPLIAAHHIFCRALGLRDLLTALKLKLLCASIIGRRVRFGRGFSLHIPAGTLTIGDDTIISDRCTMEISSAPLANLQLGARCFLAHDVHLAASRQLVIGNEVRIAEFSSLRDSSHRYKDKNRLINVQGDDIGTIIVEDDVWIGRGCLILGSAAGTVIGRGAVIGAHAIVKSSIPSYAIVVGTPAKVIGYRQ